jgi:hypothetical protein
VLTISPKSKLGAVVAQKCRDERRANDEKFLCERAPINSGKRCLCENNGITGQTLTQWTSIKGQPKKSTFKR